MSGRSSIEGKLAGLLLAREMSVWGQEDVKLAKRYLRLSANSGKMGGPSLDRLLMV